MSAAFLSRTFRRLLPRYAGATSRATLPLPKTLGLPRPSTEPSNHHPFFSSSSSSSSSSSVNDAALGMAIPVDRASKVNRLLEEFGIGTEDEEEKPPLSESELRETIAFYKTLFEPNGIELASTLRSKPRLLFHKREHVERVVEALSGVGMETPVAVEFLSTKPYLLEMKLEVFRQCVELLRVKGFDEGATLRQVVTNAHLFTGDSTEKLEGSLEFWENRGFPPSELVRLLRRRPRALGYSIENNLLPKVEFFEKVLSLKDKMARMKLAIQFSLGRNVPYLEGRIDLLVGLGLERRHVLGMLMRWPALFGISGEAISKKTEFLTEVLKRPVQDLIVSPQFLLASLEDRIKPRARVLDWLLSKRTIPRIPFAAYGRMNDTDFMRRYVKTYPGALAVYNRVQKGATSKL